MSIYANHVLPCAVHGVCGMKPIRKQRRKMVPHAYGRVLEVGMGTELNLPYYDRGRVEMVWGLEPSEGMRRKARRKIDRSGLEVEWLNLPGEEIPLDDNSADTVVLTYALCTIPGWRQAVHQMRRVLKPGGTLVFCEHREAPDGKVRKWQARINPLWKKLAGGCHLNRPIPRCLEEGASGSRRWKRPTCLGQSLRRSITGVRQVDEDSQPPLLAVV